MCFLFVCSPRAEEKLVDKSGGWFCICSARAGFGCGGKDVVFVVAMRDRLMPLWGRVAVGRCYYCPDSRLFGYFDASVESDCGFV